MFHHLSLFATILCYPILCRGNPISAILKGSAKASSVPNDTNVLSVQDIRIDSNASGKHQGQVIFFGPGSLIESDRSIKFDLTSKILHVDRLSTGELVGNLNFRGGTISHADLKDVTIEGLKHITVETLGIASEASESITLKRMALIDERGIVSTAKNCRWDEERQEIILPAISSWKSDLEVRSNLNMNSHTIINGKIESGTILENLLFKDGIIENSVLKNVTAENFMMGVVEMESATLSNLREFANTGILGVGKNGEVIASKAIRDTENEFIIAKSAVFTDDVDFAGNNIYNVNIISGKISGPNIGLDIESVSTKSLKLKKVQEDKKAIGSRLLVVDENGNVQRGLINISENGMVGDMHFYGNLHFSSIKDHNDDLDEEKPSHTGQIINAKIEGGSASNLESLLVVGDTWLEGSTRIVGDSFIDGTLTVSGSILGSGPYIDASDLRFKRDINPLNGHNTLQSLLMLRGVTYKINENVVQNYFRKPQNGTINDLTLLPIRGIQDEQKTHVGFIAQEVNAIFPELVETDPQGYQGVAYARFVPLIVESVKELNEKLQEMINIQKKIISEKKTLENYISKLEERMDRLEHIL